MKIHPSKPTVCFSSLIFGLVLLTTGGGCRRPNPAFEETDSSNTQCSSGLSGGLCSGTSGNNSSTSSDGGSSSASESTSNNNSSSETQGSSQTGEPDPTTSEGPSSTSTASATSETGTSGTTDPTPQPECGNGVKEDGEECDHGGDNTDKPNLFGEYDGICRTNCQLAGCGDGIVDGMIDDDDNPGEACDEGENNGQILNPNAEEERQFFCSPETCTFDCVVLGGEGEEYKYCPEDNEPFLVPEGCYDTKHDTMNCGFCGNQCTGEGAQCNGDCSN